MLAVVSFGVDAREQRVTLKSNELILTFDNMSQVIFAYFILSHVFSDLFHYRCNKSTIICTALFILLQINPANQIHAILVAHR